MKLIPLLLLLSGCAVLHSRTESPDGSTTHVTAFTLFDSHNEMTKFSNASSTVTNGMWSAGTRIGTLQQTSESSNLVNVIQAVAEGVVKGMK